ncbi:MAG: hypothetical protein WA782_06140 [Sulfitobacter sp.]
MNGYQNSANYTDRPASASRAVPIKTIFGSLILSVFPMQASAIGYLTCILPANDVAVSVELDTGFATRCFSEHLDDIFGATANYYSMKTAHAKSNLESATANVVLMPPEIYNATGYDLVAVVTAFGSPGDMNLDSGQNFKELAMISAVNQGSAIVPSHEMGEGLAVEALREYNFAALSMAEDNAVQHFHVVGINCN